MITDNQLDSTATGLNADAYQSLRSQVQRLKTEHKQVLGARQVARQLENLTNLQHQNEAHVQEQAHLDKVAKLQSSLHESKEHCGKLRQQYERAQRVLQAKVERLTKQLEEQRSDASKHSAELEQKHAHELQSLQLQVEEQQQHQVAQAKQWDAERHDIESKAAQWCEAEVQAVRRQAADTLAAAEARCDSWSQQCQAYQSDLDDARASRKHMEAKLGQSQLDSAQLHSTIDSLKSELATATSASSHLQTCLSKEEKQRHADVQKCRAEHERRLAEARQQQLQEVDVLHSRFRQVVQKKDESHAAMKAQLQQALMEAQQSASLLEQQRAMLLQLTAVGSGSTECL